MVFNRTRLIYTNFITSKNMKQPQPCDHFLLYSPWSARETFNVLFLIQSQAHEDKRLANHNYLNALKRDLSLHVLVTLLNTFCGE